MTAQSRIIATDMDLPSALVREAGASSFDVLKIDKVPAALRGRVEVLLLNSSGLVNRELFSTFPKVTLLQSMSAGVDFIDFSSIPKAVTVCSNAGAYKEPIAEHVFGMILFFARHLGRNNERLRRGTLEVSTDGTFLAGKTFGVIGAGGIGQSAARVAKAFNMHTIGINTSGKPAPNFDLMWKMERLDDVLRQSDFVLISLPLNNHTRNLIDGRSLGLMKKNATLINVARGPIVSQPDLYAHLKSHPKFKAGIDVWWSYPKAGEKFSLDFPFFELPNFLGSPHNADGVPEAIREGQKHAMENVLRYARGEPLQRVVDKSDYTGFTGARHP